MLQDEREKNVGFSICDNVYSNCIYYIAQQFSEVINGMIYGFNFIFCHCRKMFFICEDNQGEGANVINVACASGGRAKVVGGNPMALSQQKAYSPSSHMNGQGWTYR